MSRTLTYRGRADGVESDALEHDGHLLPLNEATSVPDEVADHLLSDDTYRIDTGGSSDKLTGQALDDRAAELDIEGRSEMTADEKRAAVAEAEGAEG